MKQKFRVDNPSAQESEVNRQLSIDSLKKGDFDIFHPTYYNDYFLNFIGDKPFVLTVYDLIHQIFPEQGMYEKIDKSKKLFDTAHTIIAISDSTKSDLVSIFGIPEEKVVVTHLANSMQITHQEVDFEFSSRIPSRYLLFVGGRSGYKNFLFFLQIFASILADHPDVHIVCTGAAFEHDELHLLNKLEITSHVHHTYVNDSELNYLYKNAVALVFPSMYEGFGLPVLEAFSCGCPVLTSNSSSLSEIGEDAVVYFEPKSPVSMKKAIMDILTDPSLRLEKIQQGYQQLKKFSWRNTADQTKIIYEGML